MIEAKNWDQAKRQISKTAAIIRKAASTLDMNEEQSKEGKEPSF